MKISSIRYYIEEALKSIFRNRLMSAASMVTVSACSLILILSFCVAANVDYILEQIENTVGVSAFISDDISTDGVNELYNKVMAIQYVDSADFISAEDALAEYKDTFGDDENKDILDGLENDNPLPRSFTIKVENNKYQRYVILELEKYVGNGFDYIKHESNIMDVLLAVNNVVRIVSAVLILTLGLISVIIVMNTIKITVSARSMEISIMKYVGATDWFIRWPFVIEGVLIGIVGSLIPVALCFFSYNSVLQKIKSSPLLSDLAMFKSSMELFVLVTPIALTAGVLIGIIGSASSIKRYLKV
ncbi:cell division protein FtsX [Clostridia bacterium]|nr:cell division protein FtsX [Clostridia bacterium]